MIVTPEGLNVFPEDVERALNAQPGRARLRGRRRAGRGQRGGARAGRAPAGARRGRRRHRARRERARSAITRRSARAAVWPGTELPRTEGTRKLKRRELRAWLTGRAAGLPAEARSARRRKPHCREAVLARFAPGRTIAPSTTIDELGLSSLERVELMMALEEALPDRRWTKRRSAPPRPSPTSKRWSQPPDWNPPRRQCRYRRSAGQTNDDSSTRATGQTADRVPSVEP